jgi:hypothetical protein
MKIRPGVLAWLYLRRWDIEKTYDTFKNIENIGRNPCCCAGPIGKVLPRSGDLGSRFSGEAPKGGSHESYSASG